jgi:hypothetical protein
VNRRLAHFALAAAAALIGCGLADQSSPVATVTSPLASWTTPAWFVDPANSTGAASDSNTCTTSDAPCLSYAEIATRWDTTSPTLGQDTSVTFLSSQTDNRDPVYVAPYLTNGANLLVQGTLGSGQQVATGTLGTVVPKDRYTPQLLQAVLPSGAAPGQLIVNTTHASRAWVYAAAGGNSWLISQPLAPTPLSANDPTPPEVNMWAAGDAVTLYNPVAIDIVQATSKSINFGQGGAVELYQLAVYDPAGTDRYDPFTFTSGVRVVESAIQRVTQAGAPAAGSAPTFVNTNLEADLTADLGSNPTGPLSILGGQIENAQFGIYASLRGVTLDADFIFGKGTRADLIGSTYGNVFVDASVTAYALDGTLACTPDDGTYGPPILWGSGTVDVMGVARMEYPGGANRAQTTFQGVTLELDTSTTACAAPSGTSSTWQCDIALTARNLDLAASAGGFGGTAVQPGGATISNLPVPDAGVPDSGPPDSGGGANDAGAMCFHAPPVAPSGPPVCGDGWRDPASEDCDDGLGASATAGRSCSSTCQIQDELAVAPAAIDPDASTDGAPPLLGSRTLGNGRHPVATSDTTFAVAYLEPNAQPLGMALATFSSAGVATGTVNRFGAHSTLVDRSDPVLAGLPCDRYAAAWTDFGGDGDGLGIAIALVDPAVTPTTAPRHANVTTAYAQSDADIVWTGSQIVVAWTDASNGSTGPDVRYRTFDGNFNATSGEQTLAATPDVEGDVTLATFEGSWAAAWRDDSVGAASGFEQIRVHTGSTDWTVGPAFVPPSTPGKIALSELDATHLLVVYPVGIDPGDTGVPNAASKLQAAVVNLAQPGLVTGIDIPVNTAVEGSAAAGLSHALPSVARAGSTVYLAWWTEAALGDPNGEQLWLQPVGWNGVAVNWDATEVPLPHGQAHQVGDQRLPALAANALPPGAAIVSAWDDLGKTFGSAEDNGDVVLAVAPTPARGSVPGLLGTYFPQLAFGGTPVARIDPSINFTWNGASPMASIPGENFSVRWTGQLLPGFSETYTFTTTADDGIRLWVNNTLIIDDWQNQGPTTETGTIALTAGQAVPIKVEYYQACCGDTAVLSWQSASTPMEVIPPSALVASSGAAPSGPPPGNGDGLLGTYYPALNFGGTPVTQVDPDIDFSWNGSPPVPGFPGTQFSVKWTGFVQAQYTETYTFTTNADDGIRLFVNGTQLVDDWVDQGPTMESGTIDLVAGQKYPIEVDYFQDTGGDIAQLQWSSPSTPNAIVPQSQLYSGADQIPTNGLVLWLRAGDGSSAAQWQDKSGQGNNATQTTAANQPLYNNVGGPSGTPAFEFTGAQYMQVNSALFTSQHNWTFFAVQQVTYGAVRHDSLSLGGGGASAYAGVDLCIADVVVNAVLNEGVGDPASQVGNWEAFSVWDDGTSQHADLNGASQGVIGSVTPYPFIAPSWIGTDAPHSAPFIGNIAEVIAYNRTLTSAEIQAVEAYIRKRTGIW